MTTLFHLGQNIVDMQQELAREQRFSADARSNIKKGFGLVRDAIDALERDYDAAFDEQNKATSRILGNSSPVLTPAENDPLEYERREIAALAEGLIVKPTFTGSSHE